MHLRINGHVLTISQLAPDFIILKPPIDHPPAEAEIDYVVDGFERRWTVQLPEGVKAGQRKTNISRCPEFKGSALG